MTTAWVTLETVARARSTSGTAGIVFQPLGTADFQAILDETEELLARHGRGDRQQGHEQGGRVRLPLARARRTPTSRTSWWRSTRSRSQLQGGGYGDRLLAAVFAFEEKGKPIYFIYNFKRGAFYPFVPAPGEQARDNERELRLKAQLGAELPFEEDMGAGSRSGTCRSRGHKPWPDTAAVELTAWPSPRP